MSNSIRIKRRASGSAGAPSTLKNGELAFNEVDSILYYGKGTSGGGAGSPGSNGTGRQTHNVGAGGGGGGGGGSGGTGNGGFIAIAALDGQIPSQSDLNSKATASVKLRLAVS